MLILERDSTRDSIEDVINNLKNEDVFICYTADIILFPEIFTQPLIYLKTLCMRFCKLENEHFNNICKNCPIIRDLDIIGNEITDYTSVSRIIQLESFQAETKECSINIDQLLKLSSLVNLRVLLLHHPKLTKKRW